MKKGEKFLYHRSANLRETYQPMYNNNYSKKTETNSNILSNSIISFSKSSQIPEIPLFETENWFRNLFNFSKFDNKIEENLKKDVKNLLKESLTEELLTLKSITKNISGLISFKNDVKKAKEIAKKPVNNTYFKPQDVFIQEKQDYYLNRYKWSLEARERFAENFKIFDKEAHDNYILQVMRGVALQNEAQKAGKTAVFLTMTNPSHLHPYTTYEGGRKLKKAIPNPAYDSTISIKEGTDFAQEFWRKFDRKLHKYGITKTYVKVIEPHKSFVGHLHAVVFIEPKHIELLKDIFDRTLDDCLKQSILANFSKRLERADLKQNDKDYLRYFEELEHYFDALNNIENRVGRDFEILNDINKGVGYLMKYTRKGLDPKSEKFEVIQGWRKANKIRMLTMSRNKYPLYLIKPILRNYKMYDISYKKPVIDDGGEVIEMGENLLEKIYEKLDSGEIAYNVKYKENIRYKIITVGHLKREVISRIEEVKYKKISELDIFYKNKIMYSKSRFTTDYNKISECLDVA
jgi:hypothetical protein